MQAIEAEPERTTASFQAMMISPPSAAQEALDVPGTPGVSIHVSKQQLMGCPGGTSCHCSCCPAMNSQLLHLSPPVEEQGGAMAGLTQPRILQAVDPMWFVLPHQRSSRWRRRTPTSRPTCKALVCTLQWRQPSMRAWTSRCRRCSVRVWLWLSIRAVAMQVIFGLHDTVSVFDAPGLLNDCWQLSLSPNWS